MTFEKIFNDLANGAMSPTDASMEIQKPDKKKKITYYANIQDIAKHPLNDAQMSELIAIVNILQTLENSDVGSPISDFAYDNMQEMLVAGGIPRLTGSIEINDDKKVSHTYTTLRGTLGKVYYLSPEEKRVNKNRKYLDEWIAKMNQRYFKATGHEIDLHNVEVLVQPKFDGVSCILEIKDGKPIWITRGDTKNNLASDVSHIMKIFNDVYASDARNVGIKFEVMMTEENKDQINTMNGMIAYRNSRQIVTATINASEPDYKVDYLYPVPLRIIHPGEDVESIHPMLLQNFPTMRCRLGDYETIRKFALANKFIDHNGMRFRTDGAVMTIMDKDIQRVLGRENDINLFEVAYKFTEEHGYSRVRHVEFYVSEFGRITPVLVVNDIILKGNTINHITLSNKERFDELGLHYGDEVKVLYDIIPYVTIDQNCHINQNGRLIPFTKTCPMCGEELDLTQTEVRCTNPNCISKVLGKILNYCESLRIKNIGYSTILALYHNDLLPHGIRSLYKLKKKADEIQFIDGFGKLKTKKMIAEIEAKRRLKDYEFFQALGIEGLSIRTFQMIFHHIQLDDFLNMIRLKNLSLLNAKLVSIKGIGDAKADLLIQYMKDDKVRKELDKLLKEVTLTPSYGASQMKGRIVFTGCRPSPEDEKVIRDHGYEPSDNWSNSAYMLIIPANGYTSSKTEKAEARDIPIVTLEDFRNGGIVL